MCLPPDLGPRGQGWPQDRHTGSRCMYFVDTGDEGVTRKAELPQFSACCRGLSSGWPSGPIFIHPRQGHLPAQLYLPSLTSDG